jgi:hypothetical protein
MQNRKFGEPERGTGAMTRGIAPAGTREAGSYPSPSFLNALND